MYTLHFYKNEKYPYRIYEGCRWICSFKQWGKAVMFLEKKREEYTQAVGFIATPQHLITKLKTFLTVDPAKDYSGILLNPPY